MGRFGISPALLVALAMALLLLPLRWVAGWVLAAVVHELSHMLAIYLCGGKIRFLYADLGGMRMHVLPLETWQECICAVAGPLGGFALALFGKDMPYATVCAFVQSTFNLLPLYPLDGGRFVRCALQLTFEASKAARIVEWIECVTWMLLAAGIFYVSVRVSFDILLPAVGIFLWRKRTFAKIPCKAGGKALQ